MAVFTGTNIDTSGLVFGYDMNNTIKSWRGEPTVNMRQFPSVSGVSGITYTYLGMEGEWEKYSISGIWDNGTYPYSCLIRSATFVGGEVYTTSCIVNTNVLDKFHGKFDAINYVNQPMSPSGTTVTTLLPDGSRFVSRQGFSYVSTTTQSGYFMSRPLEVGTTFNPDTDFLYVKHCQIENKPYPTPFVDGERTNEQAILDLTKNNQIISNSLVYNQNNTFEFDGVESQIVSSVPFSGNQENFSVFFWAKAFSRPHQYSGMVQLFGTSGGNQGGIVFTFSGNDTSLRARHWNDGGTNYSWTNTTFINGEWTAFFLIVEGKNIKIYENKELKINSSFTNDFNFSGGISIGRYIFETNYFHGIIPHIKVYDRALSQEEVAVFYEGTKNLYSVV